MNTPVHTSHPACGPGCCPSGECNDPYMLFDLWLHANGYSDVADGSPERVSLARMQEAVAAYARSVTS